MKVLVVCQHYWPENFRVTEICEALARRGHDVTALVGLPNYPTGIIPREYKHLHNRRQERNGVHIRRCFEIGRRPGKLGLAVNYVSFMTSACLHALFRRHDYDVVYAFSTSPVLMSLPAAVLRTFFPQRFVIYVLDIWPACLAAMNVPESSLLYRFMKHVSRWVYAKADVLLYSSKRFQSYLEDVHGLTIPDENYMPQFADHIFSEALPASEPQNDGLKHLVFAGNIGKVQNVEILLQAAALLKNEPVRWHFVGDGSNLEGCQQLCESLGLSDCVTFYGRRPLSEMPTFYAMADAMLVSMQEDSFVSDTLPGKVQSYMAVGKPILGSIGGETEYVLAQAQCGLCARPNDPQAFADVVRLFLAMPNPQQMGENGKRYYDRFFTEQRHMDKLEGILQRLADEYTDRSERK